MNSLKTSSILLIAASSLIACNVYADGYTQQITIQDTVANTQIVAVSSQILGQGQWEQQPANSPATNAYYSANYVTNFPNYSPYATVATYNVENNSGSVLATCTAYTSVIGSEGYGATAPNPNYPYFYYGTCTNNYELTYVSGYDAAKPNYVFALKNGTEVMQGPAWPT